jgi:hypothetical protein
MAEANHAYENGDAEGLKRILQEYECGPDSVRGTGVAADLVRTLRQLKQVRNRLVQIEEELESLNKSNLAQLRSKVLEAGSHGRDLLAEMAANVHSRVKVARQRYGSEAARMRTRP